MPHMMPMYWVLIYIFVLLLLMVIMMLLYYMKLFFNPTSTHLNKNNSNFKHNLWTWKW